MSRKALFTPIKSAFTAFLILVLMIGFVPSVAYAELATVDHEAVLAQVSTSAGSTTVKQVNRGIWSTAVLLSDGSLWTWGADDKGFLGADSGEKYLLPRKVMSGVEKFSMNNLSGAAIKKDGTLWTWGGNSSGQLGDGTKADRLEPAMVEGLSNVVDIEMGSHPLALTADGKLWRWGDVPTGDSSYTIHTTPRVLLNNVESFAGDGNNGAAIDKQGNLWVFGRHFHHWAGSNEYRTEFWTPRIVMNNVADVQITTWNTVALQRDGSLWTWGDNKSGQLGDGSYEINLEPTKVLGGVESFSAPSERVFAVMSDGSLYAWGKEGSFSGSLGTGGTGGKINTPTKIIESGVRLCRGSYAEGSLVLKADGSLWTLKRTPTQMTLTDVAGWDTGQANITGWCAGSAAVTTDGSLWVWGSNDFGQLGTGTTTNSNTPIKIFENGQWLYGSEDATSGGVETISSGFLPSIDGWGFSHKGFLNAKTGAIPKNLFMRAMSAADWGEQKELVYLLFQNSGANGYCHGLAISSALTYLGFYPMNSWESVSGISTPSKPYDVSYGGWDDLVSGKLDRLTLGEWVQALHVSQFSYQSEFELASNRLKGPNAVYLAIENAVQTDAPVAISVHGPKGGHVLIPYSLEKLPNEGKSRVYVYDCNSIHQGEDPDGRYIEFGIDSFGKVDNWRYEIFPGEEPWSSDNGWLSFYDNDSIRRSGHVVATGRKDLGADVLAIIGSYVQLSANDSSNIIYSAGDYIGVDSLEFIPIEASNEQGAEATECAAYYYNAENLKAEITASADEGPTAVYYATENSLLEVETGSSAEYSLQRNNGQNEVIASGYNDDDPVKVFFRSAGGSETIELSGFSNGSVMVRADETSSERLSVSGFSSLKIEAHEGASAETKYLDTLNPDKAYGIDFDSLESGVEITVSGLDEQDGHDWDEGVVSVEPTCEGEGVTTFTCKNDDSHVRTESIPALGHDWGEWDVRVEPTYDAPGVRERVCSRCGAAEQEAITQLERIGGGENDGETGLSAVTVTDDATGVTATSKAFAGDDAAILIVTDLSAANAARASEMEVSYGTAGAAVFRAYDVKVERVDDAGNHVAVDSGLDDLILTFPVDVAYDGRAAKVVHLHDDGGNVVVRTYALEVADGKLVVATGQLSEFAISVAGEDDGGASEEVSDRIGGSANKMTEEATRADGSTANAKDDAFAVMHRLYNPNSGEHFYTSDDEERDRVVEAGWIYEGVGWKAPEAGDPVYRLYNANGGEHHYTLSCEERDALLEVGWIDEGVGWCSDESKATPLYRLYNPNAFANNHHFTADADERDFLISIGWRDEGVAWHGLP